MVADFAADALRGAGYDGDAGVQAGAGMLVVREKEEGIGGMDIGEDCEMEESPIRGSWIWGMGI